VFASPVTAVSNLAHHGDNMRPVFALIPLGLACSEYAFQKQSDAGSGEDVDTSIPDPDDPAPVEIDEVFGASLELEVNKIDVAFLLDTTCSMGSTANAVASEYGSIVSELELTVGDAAYGFATYDDYNYASMGTSGDLPFILLQQVTTDRLRVQAALDTISIHNGNDIPESTMEGLYQALTGAGFDQDGDGLFNFSTDVRPFASDPSDTFGGTASSAGDPSTPGGGILGGFGFRDGSLPVIVYATDATMRDPDAGHDTPPEANFTAGASDVVIAASARGARLIGISAQTSNPVAQMQQLAIATDSLYAADGDGLVDDPLVLTWAGTSSAFRDKVVDAIEGMLQSVTFSTVSAEIVGNTYGFETEVSPGSYTNVTVGAAPVSLSFTVTVTGEVPASDEEQTYPMTLNIYGDDTTLLGSEEITVVVPASL
jgi:hypothetical protein